MTQNSAKNKGGRPRKEGSSTRIKSSNWRLVIPHLEEYTTASSQQLMTLKNQVLQELKQRQKGLRYYHIALEHHADGIPHLDILLIYERSVQYYLTHFDYLLKHPNITTYKKLNASILDYGKKQDKESVSNLPQSSNEVIQVQRLKQDPYSYLYDRMKQDPLHFNLQEYVEKHQLSKVVTNWSSIKVKLKDMQLAAANLLLKQKPGFRYINRALIEASLTPEELLKYDSWSGYQTIVDKMNQMIIQRGDRQQKSLNLLITGAPNTGKSALIWQRKPLPGRNSIYNFCSVYPMGMSQWFPVYHSDVYHCIYWNQAKLTSYSYDTILKLLDGSAMDLSNKGAVSRKVDNPLVIMASNMTLDQMIQQKFGTNKAYITMARANMAVRVTNVIVPKGYDLFLLQKLLHYP